MKYVLWLLRVIVGVLFIFSGLIKANDPLGLSYKMDEFFEVWHMAWAAKYSLGLSVTMIAFEIISGVAVLSGYAFRVFSFLLLLLTTFFTFLTAYVYLTGKIKECGCFGDCIKISNAETFWKDVILLALVIILFAFRKRIPSLFPGYPSVAILILSAFAAFGIQFWALEHGPFHDCLPYKAGNNIWEKMQPPPGSRPAVYETTMIYEKNGQKKEFTMQNYPWQDSTWKYVDTRNKLVSEATGEIAIKDFSLSDEGGQDNTQSVLKAPGYTLFLFVKDAGKARRDNIGRIRQLGDQAEALNIPLYILSSDNIEQTKAFLKETKLDKFTWYRIDGTASKTAMRTNPGLMLLKDGTVVRKWSFRDYPQQLVMSNGNLQLN